jgi:hypothetical protein
MNEEQIGTPKKPHIRAMPWKTTTNEMVKAALGEIPFYIRRVRDLEQGIEELFTEARAAREEMLDFVCLRFRRLLDILSEERGAALPEQTVHALGIILDEVDELPSFLKLREQPRDPRKAVEIEKALGELKSSILRFNTRWRDWVEQEAPLARVNTLVDGYNRNYSIEKQCAVRYIPLDKLGFKRRDPLTTDDVFSTLPLLPEP